MSYNKKKKHRVEEPEPVVDISSKLGKGPVKNPICPRCKSTLLSWSIRCVYYCIECGNESSLSQVEVISAN